MLGQPYHYLILIALLGCQSPTEGHAPRTDVEPTPHLDGAPHTRPPNDVGIVEDAGTNQGDMDLGRPSVDMDTSQDALSSDYEDGLIQNATDMQMNADVAPDAPCDGSTEGSVIDPGVFGGCEYADPCAQTGQKSKTVQRCEDGAITESLEYSEEGCRRTTEDRLLENGTFGPCNPEGTVCNTAGTQERAQTVCRDGRAIEETASRNCTRETSGVSCGDGGAQCQDEICACPNATPTNCDGQCVQTDLDPLHCGGCYRTCLDQEECIQGNCSAVTPISCRDLLVVEATAETEFIFTACPAYISVADCRTEMQSIVLRNPQVKLCPNGSGAATGEGWCPVRGFAAACWGYVGTGGDENTECNTGAQAFAHAYMRNARTLAEKKACAVVTAVMSHESGFAPNAKSWDMFCNGGNTGAVGLFQFDFASGLDPLPAGVDAQFEQFFRGASGPTMAGLADFWMACNPRIAGATPSTEADLALGQSVCMQAGAPADQLAPSALGCRFAGVDPDPGVEASAARCGLTWSDANERCGTQCLSSEDCPSGEACFADVDPAICDATPEQYSIRCGASWADANGRCGSTCQTNEDCPSAEMCFADLDTAICDSDANGTSIRCGRDWRDANGRCGRFCNGDEDCPDAEACYADLDTLICTP